MGSSNMVSWLLWTLVALVLLIWYGEYLWRRRRLYRFAKKIPGPKGWPLIGSFLNFRGGLKGVRMFEAFEEIFQNFPDISKVWFGPHLVFCISKPEYLEKVLKSTKTLSKMDMLYKYLDAVLGPGIVTASVPVWKYHRKLLSPSFNLKILEEFLEVFNRESLSMSQTILKKHIDKEFDVTALTSKCTLNSLCETVMGIRIDELRAQCEITNVIKRGIEITAMRIFEPVYRFDFTFKWTKLCQEYEKLVNEFKSFTEKVIQQKIKNKNEFDKKPFKALLDLIINEDKFSIEEIRNEVNTFIVGGSDTLSFEMGFTFVMLAMHPEIQDRVYEEIVDVLGFDRNSELQDLTLLEYTDRVIKETLRLFPIVYVIARDVEEDLSLQDDVMLPKGSSVVMGILQVHRSEKYWKDSLKFDPDRFLQKEVAKRHPFSYIPFSGGPRNCIGYRYAMMYIKIMIATIVRKFKISTSYKNVEDVKLTGHIMSRALNGCKVAFHLRK